MNIAQDCDLAPFLGDLSQSEKLFDIKPPLESGKKLTVLMGVYCAGSLYERESAGVRALTKGLPSQVSQGDSKMTSNRVLV